MQKDMLNELKKVNKWISRISSNTEWTYNMESIKQLGRLNSSLKKIIKSIEASRIATGKIKWGQGIDFYDNTIHLAEKEIMFLGKQSPIVVKNNSVLVDEDWSNDIFTSVDVSELEDGNVFYVIDKSEDNECYAFMFFDWKIYKM